MEKEPAWWALYLGVGLLTLVVISRAMTAISTNPERTVWFWPSEVGGRECKEMHDEAKRLGAKRWACFK